MRPVWGATDLRPSGLTPLLNGKRTKMPNIGASCKPKESLFGPILRSVGVPGRTRAEFSVWHFGHTRYSTLALFGHGPTRLKVLTASTLNRALYEWPVTRPETATSSYTAVSQD